MVTIRPATLADLRAVVALYAEPDVGCDPGGNPEDPVYRQAFLELESDTNHRLLVAEVRGRVVGTFHFTVVRYVAFRGGRVAAVEAVFVDPAARSCGVGEAMMRWAIDEARRRGCLRVQLTSNKRRTRAHSFYRRLGFVASHEGMKLPL